MSTTVVKGARVTGTTGTYNPTWPSSAGGAWGAGDWGFVLVGSKPTTPSTIAAFGTNGGTANVASTNGTPTGASVGDTVLTVRYGKLAGTEGGTTVTVTDLDDSVTWAQCYVVHSTIGFDNTVRVASGADNVPGVANAAGGFSAACAAAAAFQAGDTILCAANVPASSPSPMWTAESFACAGLTFASVTEQDENASGSGNNICGVVVSAKVDTGASSGAPTITFTATVGHANSYGPAIILGVREVAPPGVPTSVAAANVMTYSADLTWAAPASGGAVTGYNVRLDGGASVDVGNVLTHTFTGLDPLTSYDLEVQSYGPGGSSAWVLVSTTTLEPAAIPYYRVLLTLGAHSWDVTSAEGPAYGPSLPLTLGWDISDSVEFFPAQADLTTLTFKVRVQDASELADVVKGSTVTFKMFVDPAADVDTDVPWQGFTGIVTQLDGETLPSLTDPDNAHDFRLSVYAADDNARLADLYVGFTSDWPIEHINDRASRLTSEADLTMASSYGGGGAWVSARDADAGPVNVLEALRSLYRDSAFEYTSESPLVFYDRPIFQYFHLTDPDNPAEKIVRVYPFRRRVYDGGTVTLDGARVLADGRWQKRPGPAASEWVIVDGTTFGTPSGRPYVRRTSLLDYTGDPPGSDTNYSAFERDALGNSLLPDGSTALDGWASRSLRYAAWVNPDPVAGWAGMFPGSTYDHPNLVVTPVVITPLSPELELNGVDYLAGTLTGARLVIPAGGRYYVEFRLRAELLPNTDLPA